MPARTSRKRRNALQSTGPRTPAGKRRSSLNAVKHGIRSPVPVIPFLERAEDWEAHRTAILEALAPLGALEALLADRIALTAWRLGRVLRFETESISVAQEKVETDIRNKRAFMHSLDLERAGDSLLFNADPQDVRDSDRMARETYSGLDHLANGAADDKPIPRTEALAVLHEIERAANAPPENGEEPGRPDGQRIDVEDLDLPGVPEEEDLISAEGWNGWTLGTLRGAIAAIAEEAGLDPEDLLHAALQEARSQAFIADLERRNVEAQISRHRRLRLLPEAKALDTIGRYESHLERSLYRSLHELQRLQAARQGGPAPAALDVELAIGRGP
jgi:hypothetical protein